MSNWLEERIRPMLAGSRSPFDSPDYLYEVKWDGIRILAFFGGSSPRLQGRKRRDATSRYPEVVRALARLPGSGILDGEVVVLEADGRPSFGRVLIREQTASRESALVKAREHPAAYVAFDILYRDGEPLCERPLRERKAILSELMTLAPKPLVESTYVIGDGVALFEAAREKGLEGIVAKRLDGRYACGERSDSWLKIKVHRQVDAVLIGLSRESARGRVKSLVLGAYEGPRLVWLGNVGSGLDQSTLDALRTELGPLAEESPPGFSAQVPGTIDWIRPALVVRVQYSELTRDGRLRHPVFVGFVDKPAAECIVPPRVVRP